MKDIVFVLLNFWIKIIFQLTNKHLIFELVIYLIKKFNEEIIDKRKIFDIIKKAIKK